MTVAISSEKTAGLKILFVDDDLTALEELNDIVDLEGWDSVSASCVETALDMLEADLDIQIVVTDVHFIDPTGKSANGIQFVSRAQARFPERPISYLVLSGDPDAVNSSVQVGAFNFLSKPFFAEDLIDAIKSAAASGGGERENASEIYKLVKNAGSKNGQFGDVEINSRSSGTGNR